MHVGMRPSFVTASLVMFAAAVNAAPVTTSILGSAADAKIKFASGNTGSGVAVTDSALGAVTITHYSYNGSFPPGYAVHVFQLPDLGTATNPFTAATYSFGARFSGTVSGGNNTALAVTAISGSRATDAVQTGDLTATGTGLGNVMTAYGWVGVSSTNEDSNWAARTVTSASLTSFLNSAYAGGTGAGQYVFFRLSDNNSYQGASDFQIAMAENSAATLQPTLSLTYSIPEPGTMALGAGTISLMALRRRRVGE